MKIPKNLFLFLIFSLSIGLSSCEENDNNEESQEQNEPDSEISFLQIGNGQILEFQISNVSSQYYAVDPPCNYDFEYLFNNFTDPEYLFLEITTDTNIQSLEDGTYIIGDEANECYSGVRLAHPEISETNTEIIKFVDGTIFVSENANKFQIQGTLFRQDFTNNTMETIGSANATFYVN